MLQFNTIRVSWALGGIFLALSSLTGCQQANQPPVHSASGAAAGSAKPAEEVRGSSTQPAPTANGESASEDAAQINTTPSQPAKYPWEPIYHPEISGRDLIAAAIQRAQRDRKHILIEWGGNWCVWCIRLHKVFQDDEVVQPLVFEEYELVLVDSNSNQDLLREYGGKDRQYSYPHLTVLDDSGNVLTNQNTEPLEDGRSHNSQRVVDFLTKWKPEKVDAEASLSAALKLATESDRRVLVRVGTPYCGWCNVLAQFVTDHAGLFAKDYVDLKIDTLRMSGGEEVAKRIQPADSQGVPWMVILDGAGKSLASSVGPTGNIGYPYQPAEIEHFIDMLRATRKNLSDSELENLSADLTKYREDREQELSSQRAKR